MITSFCRTLLGRLPGNDGARKASIFFGLLLGSVAPAAATTYYIDPAGSNANNGTSTSTPWQNFTNVNSRTLLPGDQVLLKRGAIFTQWLQIHGSGTANNFITVGAYGTGARPMIRRATTSDPDDPVNVADRCLTAYDPSYLKIEHLEVCNAGAGIVIHYDNTYFNRSVYIDDIVAHDFYGIKFNAYRKSENPNPQPDDNYFWRGTNGWKNVLGAFQGPSNPTYWAPDHVATSAGIDLTGDWDHKTHGIYPGATDDPILIDFRVTNCEVYHAACGVAIDWQHWADRDFVIESGSKSQADRHKLTDFVMDSCYIHDIDDRWVSIGGLLISSTDTALLKNCLFYRASYFASGGTSIMSLYNDNDLVFDNLNVRTVRIPAESTTDLSFADVGGVYGWEVRNSTFENSAGYGFSFLLFSTGTNTGLNFHDNTYNNVCWYWKSANGHPVNEIFHTTGDPNNPKTPEQKNNKPAGTINTNYYNYAPGVKLTDTTGRWVDTTFYKNDTMANPHPGLDLALGKTATASSVFGTGHEASKLTDGNDSTYWASPYSANQTQSVTIDLGAPYAFNEIQVVWQTPSYAYTYEHQISNDGVHFEVLFDADLTANSGTTDDVFSMRKARYVKTVMTKANPNSNPGGDPNYGIWAIHIFNSENVAQGATSTASSTYSPPNNGAIVNMSTPAYGNDGNDASLWVSDPTTGTAYYKVDLGSPQYINEIYLNWGPQYAKSYAIKTSTDDATYATKKSVTSVGAGGIVRVVFPLETVRYIKVEMTQGRAADPIDYSIHELKAFGARNLAQDVVGSASSTNPSPGLEPARALDGNGNTHWSSTVGSGTRSFTVDLGQVQQMNEFITDWGTSYAKDYKILVSTDGTNYVEKVNRTGIASASTTTDKLSSTVSARYVKINMTQGYQADSLGVDYSIDTFQVLNNLALGATCTASTTNATYPVANAVDTNDATRWSSLVDSNDKWFRVDLGSSKVVDRLLINWDTAYAKDYTIATSTDGITWPTAVTRAGVRTATVTDDKFVAPVSARYIKITMTQGYVPDPTNYSINTLKVYGPHP